MTLINDRIEIDPARPLPEHDTPFAKAYAARMKSASATAPMMALVCSSPLPVRSELVAPERMSNHPGLMRIRDSGVVAWPLTNTKAYAFGYEVPVGRRIFNTPGSFTPMREDTVITSLIKPAGLVLAELARMFIFHGGVRADNIYFAEGEASSVVLGDHLAQPVALGQPVVYETIERGLASDIARGSGGPGDDLYALGVTVIVALLGEVPLRELNDPAIVQLKMERGSYTALLGERRFGGALTELLRGLLADDVKQRWTHADLDMWLEGRRQTPKQAMAARKASRPLRFNGQEFLQPRQLAVALAADTKQAASVIKNEEIVRWMGHGLSDEEGVVQLQEAMKQTRRQRGGPEDERLVANTICSLDPGGPIRYRGVAVFPGGIPAFMADLVLKEIPPAIVAEIIQNDMPTIWLAAQTEKRPDLVSAGQLIDRAKEQLEKSQLGFGLERALYEINPSLPCLSPPLRDSYAISARQLLEGLDKRARDAALIDRHIAAFILARDRKVMPQLMRAIEQAKDTGMRGLALLTLYSDLQYRLGPDKLPGLAAALLPMTEETVRRFKNRARQEKLRKDLKVAAAEGDLAEMLKLVDDPDLIRLDEEEFAAARMLYRETENEVTRMSAYARNKKALAIEAGEPLASVIAVVLAFLLMCVVIVRVFMQG